MTTNSSSSCSWQECFDESTGFPYYWNVETNSVTWEMPEEYKLSLASKPAADNHKTSNLPHSIIKNNNVGSMKPGKMNTPPRIVYRIKPQKDKNVKVTNKTTRPKSSDSDDEKIELITSYGEESESEEENPKDQIKSSSLLNNVKRTFPIPEPIVPNIPIGPTKIYRIQPELQVIYPHKIAPEPEILDYNLKPPSSVLQTNIQTIVDKIQKESSSNAKSLFPIDTGQDTILGKEKRPVHDIIAQIEQEQPPDLQPSKEQSQVQIKTNKPLFSLVAGYGDDTDPEEDDNEENDENSSEAPRNTLFPILDSIPAESKLLTDIDEPVESLVESKKDYISQEASEEILDTKAFKRKRRIALDVLPTKQKKTDSVGLGAVYSDHIETERVGFGFQTIKDETNSNNDRAKYKVGGISFIKAETINTASEDTPPQQEEIKVEENSQEKDKDLDEMGELVREKVTFLGEGKEPVSAVQIMIIQLQTLIEARKENGLSNKYFRSWLNKTASELTNLEREATPIGWTCQWDRSHKRYFYRNQQTGHTQWEYPDMGIAGGAEAMDICTTPPPIDDDVVASKANPGQNESGSSSSVEVPQPPKKSFIPQPPPPPRISERIPTPPPPPIITGTSNSSFVPPLPPDEEKIETTQPLPPGIDSQELPYVIAKPNEVENKNGSNINGSSFGMELESFYSDIAMLDAGTSSTETSIQPPSNEATESTKSTSVQQSNSIEDVHVKKKKKQKASKLSSGLTLKKKEVSLLVEKWKKVQNDF